jgi:hypothetical protein
MMSRTSCTGLPRSSSRPRATRTSRRQKRAGTGISLPRSGRCASRASWLAISFAPQRPDEIDPLLDLGEALREASATLSGPELRELPLHNSQCSSGPRGPSSWSASRHRRCWRRSPSTTSRATFPDYPPGDHCLALGRTTLDECVTNMTTAPRPPLPLSDPEYFNGPKTRARHAASLAAGYAWGAPWGEAGNHVAVTETDQPETHVASAKVGRRTTAVHSPSRESLWESRRTSTHAVTG